MLITIGPRVRLQLRSCATRLTFLEGHLLDVRARRRKQSLGYWLDLRFVAPEPVVIRQVAWRCLQVALAFVLLAAAWVGVLVHRLVYVPLRETVRSFREILDGKCDDLPEQAFYMVGTIEEAVEMAAQIHDIQNMTDTTDTQDMPPMRERGVDTPPPPANPSRSEAPLPLAYTEAAGLVLAAWPPEKRCAPRGVVMAIRQDSGHPDGHTCRKIAEAARVWVAAYEAQGRVQYLPRLDNWISSGAWREAPPADAPAAAGPARRPRTKSGDPAVTAAELGAIIEHAKAAGL